MEVYREQSIIVGILYLLVFITGIFSVSKITDDSDYLTKSALNPNKINRAAGFQFLMAIFHLAVVLVLYPILKNYHEALAIGFLSTKILAFTFIVLGTIVLFSILRLSREYSKCSGSDTSGYSTRGNQLKHFRDLINHVGMIVSTCFGSIALYIILFQYGLIPTWISVWGIIGAIVAIFASLLVAIGSLKVKNIMYIILNIPIALQEVVFSIWLISKGIKAV